MGTYTPNNMFYKPAFGASGSVEKAFFDAGLDQADAAIVNLSSLITNGISEDDIVTLITAANTYVDSNTFKLAGNFISKFPASAVVEVQLTGSRVHSTVQSSTYAAGETTVNLNDTVLSNTIVRIYVVATRGGFWPNRPGYIVAEDYGTSQADLVTADSIAYAAGKQLVIGCSYSITNPSTLSAALKIVPGALFTITNTTLTINNGGFDVGYYPVFSCIGTGEVIFAFSRVVCAEWFGLSAGADDTINGIALQRSCDSIESKFGTVSINRAGTYLFTNFTIPVGINFHGTGAGKTILSSTGAGYSIKGSGKWNAQTFKDFDVIHASNANSGVVSLDADKGASSCIFENIEVTGKGGVSAEGVYVRGKDSTGTANNNCSDNLFINVRAKSSSGVVTASAIKIGYDQTGCRANANQLLKCVVGGYDNGIEVDGASNIIDGLTAHCDTMTYSAIKMTNRVSSSWVRQNSIRECYFSGTFPGTFKPIKFVNEYNGANNFGIIRSSYGLNDPFTGIELAGTYASQIYFNWNSDSGIIVGGSSNKSFGYSYGYPRILPLKDDGIFGLMGSPTQPSGAVYVSGQTYTGTSMLAAGGVSAILINQAGSAFRIIKTTTGTTGVLIFEIDTVTGAMTNINGNKTIWQAHHPETGVWNVGDICWTTIPSANNKPGWMCVFSLTTSLNGGEPSGEKGMFVNSSAGVLNADWIGVMQNNGEIKWSYIVSGQGTSTLTMNSALDYQASSGNAVYITRWLGMGVLASGQ